MVKAPVKKKQFLPILQTAAKIQLISSLPKAFARMDNVLWIPWAKLLNVIAIQATMVIGVTVCIFNTLEQVCKALTFKKKNVF